MDLSFRCAADAVLLQQFAKRAPFLARETSGLRYVATALGESARDEGPLEFRDDEGLSAAKSKLQRHV